MIVDPKVARPRSKPTTSGRHALARTRTTRPYDRIKRLIDVVFAATALLVLSPVVLVVTVAVLADLGRPVLFRQTRPGRDGRLFRLVKFRTMRMADAGHGAVANLATDGDRLTRLGRWLRAASLDELPTLWNVLRGEMSLVGPRPLLVEYLDRYTREQARRHEVRPGITGLAQVRGRNGLSWEEKFVHDVSYVDQRSLALDLRILAATVGPVLRRGGIAAEGTATAREYVRPRQPEPDTIEIPAVERASTGQAGDPVG